MSLYRLLAAAGLTIFGTLSLTSCEDEEPAVCFDPSSIAKPNPIRGQELRDYPHGTILADERISREATDYYATVYESFKTRVLDFLGFDTPWQDRMHILMKFGEAPRNDCSIHAGGCAPWGQFTVYYNESEIEQLNEDAELGLVTKPNTLLHETGHALRQGIADPWWGLEEGLATYLEYHLIDNVEPTERAAEVINQTASVTHWVDLTHVTEEILGVRAGWYFVRDAEDYVTNLEYSYRGDSGELSVESMEVASGDFVRVADLIIKIERVPLTNSEAHFTIYKRAENERGVTDQRQVRTRDEDTWTLSSEIYLESGESVLFEDGSQPFVTLTSYERGDNPVDLTFNYYDTAFWFWQDMREEYGHRAVATLLHSMAEFSKEQQAEAADFSFFDTYVEMTETSRAAAQAVFEKYSVPTEDSYYPIGGVCWPSL